MSDMTTISVRTDKTVKEQAKQLYADMGLDLSTAINIFLRQSITDNGMPFVISRESNANIEARREADNHQGKTFSTVNDLMDDLQQQ
ncbi:MAG: type II toxin-antitoxin system RelB/DinJ family antitoxin [Bifidobacteriaceae bacterium]|nr:type II toxin-antitoxin system RelB/DinJ family antitoxin [Bifidobacteriaceae bacterium]